MFILVEGIDKLGKTTLINKLASYYGLFGYDVVIWNDFDTIFGQKVKEMFHVEHLEDATRVALLRNLRKYSTKKLDKLYITNSVVILDRFCLSTIAYQKDVQDFKPEWDYIKRYAPKMITILLTCNNLEFVKNKLSPGNPLEREVLENYDILQARFVNCLVKMQEFCTKHQLYNFKLDNNYVDFSEVITKIEEFRNKVIYDYSPNPQPTNTVVDVTD